MNRLCHGLAGASACDEETDFPQGGWGDGAG